MSTNKFEGEIANTITTLESVTNSIQQTRQLLDNPNSSRELIEGLLKDDFTSLAELTQNLQSLIKVARRTSVKI